MRLLAPGCAAVAARASLSSPSTSTSFVPFAPPPLQTSVVELADFIGSAQRLACITGAGVSTESGLQDYRSPLVGAYSRGHRPMTHQAFVSSEDARRRYWTRSYLGWEQWASRQPNAGHVALARLAAAGRMDGGLTTQNVDRLHHKAGHSGRLVELHGTTHRVVCLGCGAESCRAELQERLRAANPALLSPAAELGVREAEARPDGDAVVGMRETDAFQVVDCSVCGGPLKPQVVFFGDSLPPAVAAEARRCVEEADALLVVGTSLSTWSAYRLCTLAHSRRVPIALLTVGESRADHLASLRIEARAGEMLQRVVAHGCLDVPLLGAW